MTLVKLKTWWRIQKRMALIYLTQLFYYIEWPLRFTINLLIFLAIPFWVGPFYMINILYRAWQSKKNVERDVMTGKIWYWDQFNLY